MRQAHYVSPLPRALRPFETKQYRLLVGGLALAMFSDGVWLIAIVWQVIALGGGPGQVSLVSGIAAVGMVVSTLAGGVLADRVSQRLIMIGLETAKLVVFAVVGIASVTGTLALLHLVCAALIIGVTTGMYYPAYSAMLPSIVAAAQLQAANGIEGFLRPVIYQASGPMLAGVIIGALNPGAAILLAGVASALSALCYVAMKPVALRRDITNLDAHPVRAVVSDLSEGFVYMWRTPWLWATLFYACILVLLTMGPIEVLVPFALRERAGGDASDHSFVLAAFGVGAALGAFIFASIRMARRYLTVMFTLWAVCAVPFVIMGFARSTWLFVLAGILIGIAFDGPMVLWGTLLQRRVPPALLGRVSSLDFFVSAALMPVSMAIAAPVAEAIGFTATFVLAGLLPIPCAIAFYVAARLWRDEIAHPLATEHTEVDPVATVPVTATGVTQQPMDNMKNS